MHYHDDISQTAQHADASTQTTTFYQLRFQYYYYYQYCYYYCWQGYKVVRSFHSKFAKDIKIDANSRPRYDL